MPETLNLPDNAKGIFGIVASDDFERKPNDPKLPLAWQWNHNPDDKNWEILQNPGRLRITTARIDTNVLLAKNTLTQRTFGPRSSATTSVNISNMKNGDIAGLIALQNKYGYVGVTKEDGKSSIIMVESQLDIEESAEPHRILSYNELSTSSKIMEQVPIEQDNVYFRIDGDFVTDTARFYYSFDGEKWNAIGESLQMVYTLTKHFMGYRFGLFNYATQETGGYVDFDYYRVDETPTSKKP